MYLSSSAAPAVRGRLRTVRQLSAHRRIHGGAALSATRLRVQTEPVKAARNDRSLFEAGDHPHSAEMFGLNGKEGRTGMSAHHPEAAAPATPRGTCKAVLLCYMNTCKVAEWMLALVTDGLAGFGAQTH